MGGWVHGNHGWYGIGKWGVGRGSHEGTKVPRRWMGSWVVVETGKLGSLPHLGWGVVRKMSGCKFFLR